MEGRLPSLSWHVASSGASGIDRDLMQGVRQSQIQDGILTHDYFAPQGRRSTAAATVYYRASALKIEG